MSSTQYKPPMPDLQSPSKPNAGSMNNFASGQNTFSSRKVLRQDLAGRVQYDVSDIITERLGFYGVSELVVEHCCGKIIASRTLERLRFAISDYAEEDMYEYLEEIFREVEASCTQPDQNARRSYHRQAVNMKERSFNSEGLDLLDQKPSFLIVELPPNGPGQLTDLVDPIEHGVPLRQAISFVKVKMKEIERPEPTEITTGLVKELTGQAADYGGLIASGRPFHLFTIGLVIYGPKFCVGMFDRDGVLFSKEYDMFKDLKMFVRVIRSLLCDMSPENLGQDPSVKLAPDHTYYQESYPSFEVRMGGNRQKDSRCWTTHGKPLWVSLSLLGRGTSVWHATAEHTQSEIVLKNSWRDPARMSESRIYTLAGKHPGIATFIDGGDVYFPVWGDDKGNVPLNVGNLRHSLGVGIRPTRSTLLNRVLIRPVGRSPWEFDDEKEFYLGLRAALEGHQYLFERGILHRDISAGNVFLYDPKRNHSSMTEGRHGFLADLELAFTPKESVETVPQAVPSQPNRSVFVDVPARESQRGPEMTGTVQFMAIDILESICSNPSIRSSPLPRQVYHDLESFVWVIIYSIYRHIISKTGGDSSLRNEFQTLFGKIAYDDILSQRRTLKTGRLRGHLNQEGRESLEVLLTGCKNLVSNQNPQGLEEEISAGVQARINKIQANNVHKVPIPRLFITYGGIFSILDEALNGGQIY